MAWETAAMCTFSNNGSRPEMQAPSTYPSLSYLQLLCHPTDPKSMNRTIHNFPASDRRYNDVGCMCWIVIVMKQFGKLYITVTYKLNIEKCVFMYKYTLPIIVHTYKLVYTLNMQKRNIVDTLYHTLCVSGQNSTKQTSIFNISESETLDNTRLSSILEHILLLTNSVILVNCKPFLTLYLTSGSPVLHWLDWF